MKIYIKNIETNQIKIFEVENYGVLSKEFRQPPYVQSSESEILAYELQEAKTSKLSELAKNREFKAEKSFVIYDNKPYSNSPNARIAINGRIGMMQDNSPARYYQTYPDGEIVWLVKADFVALANLIDENESNLREQEIGLIYDINACTTLEELNAINIEF